MLAHGHLHPEFQITVTSAPAFIPSPLVGLGVMALLKVTQPMTMVIESLVEKAKLSLCRKLEN